MRLKQGIKIDGAFSFSVEYDIYFRNFEKRGLRLCIDKTTFDYKIPATRSKISNIQLNSDTYKEWIYFMNNNIEIRLKNTSFRLWRIPL